MNINAKSLLEMNGGAFMERTDYEVKKVLDNILDANTKAVEKRKITLKPYRTFAEVDQPESLFLIRISERGISFIEADGGMWRLTARKTIKEYLEQQLKDQVAGGEVVVML